MSAEEHNLLGRINISPVAVATVASQAALQSYGVVGMAAKNVVDGITNMISRDPRHGVDVIFHPDGVSINLFVIVEYGTRISTVAASLASAVQFNIEKSLGLNVKEVNVHVQGLRISDPQA
jgi:uncharacterized alkaline shock family protein YloU